VNSIDFDAYAKFSRPGPRYTSYPTALEFSENFKIKLAISPSCCTKLGVAEFCRVEFRRAAEPCKQDERVFLSPSKQAPSKRREI